MKKVLSLILVLVMCLSLCACAGGSAGTPTTAPTTARTTAPTEPEITVVQLNLGDTASTDLIDFTLTDCTFAYYAESSTDRNPNSPYMTPVEEDHFYAAGMGRCFIVMEFVLKNKNRTSLKVAGSLNPDWKLDLTLDYKDKEYTVNSWGLNNKNNGEYPFTAKAFSFFDNEWRFIETVNYEGYILDAGATYHMRALGIVKMDPSSLNDGFELTINLPNADGGYDYFTFVIPSK